MLRLLILGAVLSAGPEPGGREWQRLVGIVQYLQDDYPDAVASGDQSELEEQASLLAEAEAAARELGPGAAPLLPRLSSIRTRVLRAEDAPGVSRDCAALVEEAVALGGLQRSPRQAPDLEAGRRLYAVSCAVCHGLSGDAKTPVAATMNPPPKSFQDAALMDALSPYKAFNVVSVGVSGTPMPEFTALSEADRWAVAFYVFTLRQPPCEGQPPRATLEQLSRSTDAELAAQFGPAALACLRRKLPAVDEERAWMIARGGVDDAMKRAASGDLTGARQSLLDAYLDGVEPVEPRLRARDPALVQALESAFLQARLAAEQGSPGVQDEVRRLRSLLDRAAGQSGTRQDFWSVLWMAALILLREGFEATVVIAALLAVLKKLEQREHARIVHAGWISALAAGGVAFAFARTLISGQNRELVEGGMSLLAVGMLLYAALWLNARSNIRKWMGQIRSAMQGAIGRGSLAGLFAISFTAMFRESFETAVFLQGLAIDSAAGALWGTVAGAVGLVGLVLFIGRVGYRLPMKPLFNASTVLLVVTAVVLLGKGLHALQEVGLLPLMPIRMVEVEALGVYPDALSFFPQLLLALAPLVWLLARHRPDGTTGEEISPPGAKHA
ncbi:MAG TPA: FTR1 family protein [Myxococcales bacterium]|nr:FTR1 family protein [Myxococcales bacterium]